VIRAAAAAADRLVRLNAATRPADHLRVTHLNRALPRPTAAGHAGRVTTVLLAAVGLVAALVAPSALASGDAGPGDGGGQRAGTVVGTVERVQPDHFGTADGADEQGLTFVHTADGALQVPSGDLAGVPTGATVEVRLADPTLADAAVTNSAGDGKDAQSGAAITDVHVIDGVEAGSVATGDGTARVGAAAASGTHQVLVVVADLPGQKASGTTAAKVAATVNGPVDDYWSTVTGGRVSFHATAYAGTAGGRVTTTTSPCKAGSVAGTWDFWDEVAAKVGFTDGADQHLLVYFAQTAECAGIAGLGTIGGNADGADLDGGGRVWSNGYNIVGVLGHELGHNLGLGHSQELRCGTSVDAPLARCDKLVYNDLSDIMGLSWGNTGYLNALHLQRLGLLSSGDLVDVTSSRTVTLRPLSKGSGVRVAELTDGGTTYLVEARAAVGLDRWLGSSYGSPGVTVRKVLDRSGLSASQANDYPTRESLLLDGNPRTSDALTGPQDYRTVLPVGGWVPLASGRLGVRVDSVRKRGAVVTFRVGGTTVASSAHAAAGPARATLRTGDLDGAAGVVRMRSAWGWLLTRPGKAKAKHQSAHAVVAAGRKAWRTTHFHTKVKAPGSGKVKVRGKVRARYLPESAATYQGAWSRSRTGRALGGSERVAKERDASATFQLDCRAVGVVARKGPHRGSLRVFVDGRLRKVVKLSARHAGRSLLVWRKNFGTAGTHTVTVVRSGSKAAGIDGLIALR
jgi:hypothetical protein